MSHLKTQQVRCFVLQEPDGNSLQVRGGTKDNNKTHPLSSLWFPGQRYQSLFYSTRTGLPASHKEDTLVNTMSYVLVGGRAHNLFFTPVSYILL